MSSKDSSSREPQRTSWVPAVVVLIVAALFGYIVLPYAGSHSSAQNGKLVGQLAPDFTLPVFQGGDPGNRIRLSALQGNVVVLDFWASWCKPCQMQARILSQLAPAHAGEKVMFVGINTADNETNARNFAKTHELPYPSVLDTGEVADAYGANALPTLIVIDPSGRVRNAVSGVMSAKEVDAAIATALSPAAS
jgi:cytochrome c biogenesis protein CcmG/thiol:disulfide interchange protein DsbE